MYVNGSVTTPVEAPPKEARHTSIVVAVLAQAWMQDDIIFSGSHSR